MIEIRHVRSGNKPARNGVATVENWTSAGNGLSIIVNRPVTRIVRMNKRGISMKSVTAIKFGAAAALLVLIALVSPQPSHGQKGRAAITGNGTDSAGAPVPGVKVTATDTERGSMWTTTTNGDGIYDLPQVPIGTYNIKVEHTGFQSAQQANITLVLNQVARLDFQLKVGDVATSVNVTETTPLLQTDSTQVSTVMDSHAIENLPLQTRNYNQLTLLTPGAVTTSPGACDTGLATFNSCRPYINGNREQANYYLLDGIDNNEFVDNNVAFSPSVDAIQEMNIIESNPSADLGHFLGGVISVSLKSGSNQFHGDVFEFLRNDFFNASEWDRNFSPAPTVNSAPPAMRWTQFGATLGGPIIKNKLFFFARLNIHNPGGQRKSFRCSGYHAALSRNHRAHAGESLAGGHLHGHPSI